MITLPERAPLSEYQRYIHELEAQHGWLDVDLVHTCFLMGEEVGELFKAVRRCVRLFEQGQRAAPGEASPASTMPPPPSIDLAARREEAGEEIVDVMNYLLAIANRLDIDVEAAFRAKNAKNQERVWAK